MGVNARKLIILTIDGVIWGKSIKDSNCHEMVEYLFRVINVRIGQEELAVVSYYILGTKSDNRLLCAITSVEFCLKVIKDFFCKYKVQTQLLFLPLLSTCFAPCNPRTKLSITTSIPQRYLLNIIALILISFHIFTFPHPNTPKMNLHGAISIPCCNTMVVMFEVEFGLTWSTQFLRKNELKSVEDIDKVDASKTSRATLKYV